MKSETIYQIILSVLADEATNEEHILFSQWIKKSEENRKQYNRIKLLYQITLRLPKETRVDTEQAWQIVRNQTIDKKKIFKFPVWTRYAAMVAIIVSLGIILFNEEVPSDTLSQMEQIDIKEFVEPTLLLENGEKIALSE